MDDKTLMESLLMTIKGVSDLYLHGAIESNTENVHNVFDKALSDTLTMQHDIYMKMAAKGWYPTEQAPQQQIMQTKQKFASQMSQ